MYFLRRIATFLLPLLAVCEYQDPDLHKTIWVTATDKACLDSSSSRINTGVLTAALATSNPTAISCSSCAQETISISLFETISCPTCTAASTVPSETALDSPCTTYTTTETYPYTTVGSKVITEDCTSTVVDARSTYTTVYATTKAVTFPLTTSKTSAVSSVTGSSAASSANLVSGGFNNGTITYITVPTTIFQTTTINSTISTATGTTTTTVIISA